MPMEIGSAYTVRLSPQQTAKMTDLMARTNLPGTAVLRMLIERATDITVNFTDWQALASEAQRLVERPRAVDVLAGKPETGEHGREE